jgi:NAD-dependent dihydropyrimidine dehydrogenase PreA subunit
MYSKAYLTPNALTPNQGISIDPDKCVGCLQCADVCRSDVMIPSSKAGAPPIVLYPDECWFCGCCKFHCPVEAITVVYPMNQRVGWKRKETGEFFRIGMKNPPPPVTKPPVV